MTTRDNGVAASRRDNNMQDVMRDAIHDISDSLEYITTVLSYLVGCAAERYNVKVCTHVVDWMLAQRNMVGWVQHPRGFSFPPVCSIGCQEQGDRLFKLTEQSN